MRRIGTSRGDRLLRAIMPDYFQVDERDTSHLISYTLNFAGIVRYFNERNEIDGNWVDFFKQEETILLATIGSTNLDKLEHEKERLINIFNNEYNQPKRIEAFINLYLFVKEQILMLDDWYEYALKINHTFEELELERELQNAISSRLNDYYSEIKKIGKTYLYPLLQNSTYASDLPQDFIDEIDKQINTLEDVNYIWKSADTESSTKTFVKSGARGISNIGATKEDYIEAKDFHKKIQNIVESLVFYYRPIYRVIAYIVQAAPKMLEKNLQYNAQHQPHIGLFLSFLDLMKYLKKDINTITKKHLDFYYKQVLKQEYQKQTADIVPLYFTLVDSVDNLILDKGTLLSIGQDDNGIESFYALDEMAILNKIIATDFKTIFVSRNALVGLDSSYQIISNIFAAPVANSKDGLGMSFEEGTEPTWATLGEEQLEKLPVEQTMIKADIGFAIAAPILKLYEGERMIELEFKFDLRSLSGMVSLIADMSANDDELSTEDIFYKMFLNAFKVDITTEEGWLSLDKYEVKPPEDWSTGKIKIRFYLPMALPPITGYVADVHGEKYQTTLPILQIYLVSDASIYSYSFFKDLIIDSLMINVEVNNVRNLTLYNEYGLVDPISPFHPFSLQPRVGSHFLIGNSEVFSKDLTDINFNIEWFNLPTDEQSYKDYYDAYGLDIENDSFKIDFSALSDFEFQPQQKENRERFNLFAIDNDNKVEERRTFSNLNLDKIKLTPSYNLPEEIPEYNYKLRTGFFKFELVEPAIGFAHDVFLDIYTDIVTKNAQPASRIPGAKKKILPVPKQPIAPMIKQISLDYTASTKISFTTPETWESNKRAQVKYYHLHPFGLTEAFSNGKMQEKSMLPQYNNEGYLYIGLEEVQAPQILSLLFHMRQSERLEAIRFPKITWSYLTNNVWLDFDKEDVLMNSTKGFTTSGIVNLRLPRAMSDNNELMPAGKFWIRASAKNNTDVLSDIINVYTQATTASYVINPDKDDHPVSIPANSITDFKTPNALVESINQPFASFNARPQETDKHFYARVSERLRHKNRAISLWDYEHIVLEAFPQLYQVKSIGHLGYEKYVEQGKILIVVIPNVEDGKQFYHPTVDFDTLNIIKEHLEKLASPFVDIEVRNPIYERLKINCKIMFKDGYNNGKYLKLLHDEILSFICPWFYGEAVDLQLGGGILKEDILRFIEGRPYIHFVTKFSINQIIMMKNGEYQMKDTVRNAETSKILKATLPWSVLVPAAKHNFEYLDKEKYEAPEAASVTNMSLGTDFVILGADDVAETQQQLPHPVNDEEEDDNYYFFSIEI